jgi:hypothetical protein
MTDTIQALNVQIDSVNQLILETRKVKDWDKLYKLYDQYEELVTKCDALSRQLQHETDMQTMDDWYDDEMNRDAYNERIVSLYLN